MDPLEAELRAVIQAAMDAHPRSQQTRLGPSEIGKACERWLAYRMAGVTPVNPRSSSWRATVGTATHSWLAEVFDDANNDHETDRYVVEENVETGVLTGPGGYPVTGNTDLQVPTTVVDWKIVGKNTLDKAARGYVSEQYRVQSQAYAYGWLKKGVPIERVAIFFLPSAGELSQGVFWHEPVDLGLVADAFIRLNRIKAEVDTHGTQAPALLPTTDDWCSSCEFFRPRETDLTVACPGHPMGRTAAYHQPADDFLMGG